MDKHQLENVLKSFGLTEKETEVYIFLAKHGVIKCQKIARQLKKDKGQIYRILKNLQKKSLVEATLEHPTRFIAVPFEKVIDSYIKSKREEVVQMEKAKKDLLSVWKKIGQTEIESSLEKFAVIEGNKKINHKISQMVKETNSHFSMIATVSDLFRAEHFGVFDIVNNHPIKSKIHFRVLTTLSRQNLRAIKLLKTKLKSIINLKGTNPSLGSPKFSRMAIRDDEEIILFISDKKRECSKDWREVCLWTNCKSIIEAFSSIFEDSWRDSTNIQDRINEVENGKILPNSRIIRNAEEAYRLYHHTLDSVKQELIMTTSAKGLIACWKGIDDLKKWNSNGVSIKIMAPIVGENLKEAHKLSQICEVRHIPTDYLGTTIIDGKHLFQFKEFSLEQKTPVTMDHFENMFYTNDDDYVIKTKNMLTSIWKSAYAPSTVTLDTIMRIEQTDDVFRSDKRMIAELKNIQGLDSKDEELPPKFTEKILLKKFIDAKRVRVKDVLTEPVTFYCSAGQAVIHPPPHFKIPHMLFHILHLNKNSAFGAEDAMIILCRHGDSTGYSYIPEAFISDNPKGIAFWKKTFAGIPFEQNLVKRDKFHVQVQHNSLFAGWTVPIPLGLQKKILPPSCILIEGYGNIKTGKYSIKEPSGDTIINHVNFFEAFVTYIHPESKYRGPGTEGYFFREFLSTTYPPSIA